MTFSFFLSLIPPLRISIEAYETRLRGFQEIGNDLMNSTSARARIVVEWI